MIPSERIEQVDVLTVSRRKPSTLSQADPRSKTSEGDAKTSEVTYHTDNFTPYYWREKSEMRKYYSLPVEFPTIAGAARFATEPERRTPTPIEL